MIDLLFKHYNNKLTLPPKEDRLQNAVQFFNHNIVMIVDGVEQEIVTHVSKGDAKFTRSGKKAKNTVTKLAGVNPYGKLMWFTESYRGALNDMNLSKMVGTIESVFTGNDCRSGCIT